MELQTVLILIILIRTFLSQYLGNLQFFLSIYYLPVYIQYISRIMMYSVST